LMRSKIQKNQNKLRLLSLMALFNEENVI